MASEKKKRQSIIGNARASSTLNEEDIPKEEPKSVNFEDTDEPETEAKKTEPAETKEPQKETKKEPEEKKDRVFKGFAEGRSK